MDDVPGPGSPVLGVQRARRLRAQRTEPHRIGPAPEQARRRAARSEGKSQTQKTPPRRQPPHGSPGRLLRQSRRTRGTAPLQEQARRSPGRRRQPRQVQEPHPEFDEPQDAPRVHLRLRQPRGALPQQLRQVHRAARRQRQPHQPQGTPGQKVPRPQGPSVDRRRLAQPQGTRPPRRQKAGLQTAARAAPGLRRQQLHHPRRGPKGWRQEGQVVMFCPSSGTNIVVC
mmetsp:Transcript_11442/g.34222  ORF Transcript_11442/g.34222 Transcript_11442/m.34222 type:complete len:227 (-) Transcript_11442:763-1443(-)